MMRLIQYPRLVGLIADGWQRHRLVVSPLTRDEKDCGLVRGILSKCYSHETRVIPLCTMSANWTLCSLEMAFIEVENAKAAAQLLRLWKPNLKIVKEIGRVARDGSPRDRFMRLMVSPLTKEEKDCELIRGMLNQCYIEETSLTPCFSTENVTLNNWTSCTLEMAFIEVEDAQTAAATLKLWKPSLHIANAKKDLVSTLYPGDRFVCIAGTPPSMTCKKLLDLLPGTHAILGYDPIWKSPSRVCFVEFKTMEEAELAVEAVQEHLVLGNHRIYAFTVNNTPHAEGTNIMSKNGIRKCLTESSELRLSLMRQWSSSTVPELRSIVKKIYKAEERMREDVALRQQYHLPWADYWLSMLKQRMAHVIRRESVVDHAFLSTLTIEELNNELQAVESITEVESLMEADLHGTANSRKTSLKNLNPEQASEWILKEQQRLANMVTQAKVAKEKGEKISCWKIKHEKEKLRKQIQRYQPQFLLGNPKKNKGHSKAAGDASKSGTQGSWSGNQQNYPKELSYDPDNTGGPSCSSGGYKNQALLSVPLHANNQMDSMDPREPYNLYGGNLDDDYSFSIDD